MWNASIDRYPAFIARCAGVADVIEAVRSAVGGNPRSFLESLFNILNQAESENQKKIDLTFVQRLLDDDGEDVSEDDEETDLTNPERG